MDNYQVLGIPFGADITIIKTAYKRLVKQYHPDKTGGDAAKTKTFLVIQSSYEELLKGVTRRQDPAKKRGSYKVVNVSLKENGEYLIQVSLHNIKEVEIVNGDCTYTIKSDEYFGRLIVTPETMKMVKYNITLRFTDWDDFYGEVKYKVKKPKNFLEKIIDKIWK